MCLYHKKFQVLLEMKIWRFFDLLVIRINNSEVSNIELGCFQTNLVVQIYCLLYSCLSGPWSI